MTSLRIYFGVLMPPCMLTIWPSGPPPQTCSKHLLLSNPPSMSQKRGPTYGDFLSIQRSADPPFSLQIRIKPLSRPLLNLLGIPLLFNPTPKFLGVTFDRTLSFGAHVQSLCSKFYPRHKALRSIATASWGPTKESLSLLYKVFVQPVLTYASPGWFPFLCNTATNHLEVLHRAACRVITGCPSFTPSSLLVLKAPLPPLKLTLKIRPFPPSNMLGVSPLTFPASMPWQKEMCHVD